MKKLSILLAGVLCAASLAACSSGGSDSSSGTATPDASGATVPATAGQTLNLYTWDGMFPPEVLAGFTAQTGITINFSNFSTDEAMLAKINSNNGSEYDLIIADDYIIKTAAEQGLVQELDTTKLENYSNINPIYQNLFYDPENLYTIPYGAGVQTIVYDPSLVSVPITSYEDLWNSELADNIGVIDNYRVIDGMALKTLSESYNTEDSAVITAAGEKLVNLAPNIRLIKDANLQDDLIQGEVGAAVMYTSQATVAKMTNPELEVVFPSEGIGFGVMAGFIPSQAPNPDAAYLFMDYILRPEVAAQCFEYIGYYCTNLAAESYISEEYREFLILPSDIDRSSMEMIQPVSNDADAALQKIYTEFKTAAGQ